MKFIKILIKKIFEISVLYIVPSIVIFFLLKYFLFSHLDYYSVYYAKNIKHSHDKDPEVQMVMKNLEYIERPKTKFLVYDYVKGENLVKKINYSGNKFDLDMYVMYSFGDIDLFDEKRYIYEFNKKYEFFSVYKDEEGYSYSLSTEMEQETKQKIRDIVQPIIDVQPKPKINLQWIFNWIYEEEFK